MTGAAASTGCGAVACMRCKSRTFTHAAARGARGTSRRMPMHERESCTMRPVQGAPAS